MTNWYKSGSSLYASSALDWAADDIRALLVSSAYAFNADHAFVADLVGELTHGSYSRKILGSKSVTQSADGDGNPVDKLNAAALTWSSLAGGTNPAKLVLYKRITNDAASVLIACLDVAGTADGSQDFNVVWGGISPIGPALQITTGEGVEGPPGASFLGGTGAPGGGLGANGDHYVDTSNGNVYLKASGAWGSPVGSLLGPQGLPGIDGTPGTDGTDGSNGADGANMRSGTGAPSNGLGANGDVYISTVGNLYNKSAGTWTLIGNLTGPQGIQGNTGPAVAPPSVVTDAGGTRSLAATDWGKYTRFTSGSATSLTVPSGLSIAVGESAVIRQAGAGLITFIQGGGVTLNNLTGKTLVSAGQGATFSLTCVAADVYDLAGALA